MISPKALVVVPLLFAAVACGGLPFGNAAKPTPTPNLYKDALAYAQCMRSHGIPDFPDPNSSGVFTSTGGPSSPLDRDSPTFQAAANACKSLLATLKEGRSGMSQADKQKLLNYAACMRSHGLPDFPDPQFNQGAGGFQIGGSTSGDLNPNSPAFQAADNACRSLLPGGGNPITSGSGGSGAGSGTNGSTGG